MCFHILKKKQGTYMALLIFLSFSANTKDQFMGEIGNTNFLFHVALHNNPADCIRTFDVVRLRSTQSQQRVAILQVQEESTVFVTPTRTDPSKSGWMAVFVLSLLCCHPAV